MVNCDDVSKTSQNLGKQFYKKLLAQLTMKAGYFLKFSDVLNFLPLTEAMDGISQCLSTQMRSIDYVDFTHASISLQVMACHK